MALALYRKYRPRTFAEVIGQEHVTEPLSQALRTGRLHHAYLFSGPRGCGKTSSARILARSLNCAEGPTPEPCGTCESCRSLANDGAGSIDVIEIDAASHGGVDDARELREKAFFAPVNSRYKIYVIDEAHMVSSAGFNALLKLVEEPPDYVKFIFATTEPEKVLGTIRSRTHHYPFRLIPPGVLRPYLEQLTAAEGITVDPAVFPLVVRAGGGSVRDTLSVLDQLIAGAGPEGVSYARAAALLGVTDAGLIDEMCDALAAGDGAAVYATVNRVAEAGHDPRRFASDLLERLRDLIVLKQVPDAAAKGLIDVPADQLERMTAQAQRLGPATLSRCADIVHNGLVEMRGSTSPRLLLELICARMLLPGAEDSTGALLQRLERMERQLAAAPSVPGPVAAPASSVSSVEPSRGEPEPTRAAPPAAVISAPATSEPAAPAPAASEPATSAPATSESATPEPPPRPSAASGGPDTAEIRQRWGDVVGLVNRSNKPIAALMRDAVVRELIGDTLVLTMKSQALAQMMTVRGAGVISDALYEVFGVRWQIRCDVAGDQRGSTGAPARPAAARPASNTAPATGTARATGTASSAPASGATSRSRQGSGVPASRSADDTDWPEPARPGGAAATAADDDWPAPARPGGSGGAPPAGAAAADPTPPAPAPAARQTRPGPSGPTRPQTRPVVPTRGGAGVGAGASAAVAGDSGGGAVAAAAAGRRTGVGTADPEWAGEPPYDPDYDGPAGSAVAYEGFAPGDEPLDDDIVDEQPAGESAEERALRLLREELGAEKIGDVERR